MTVYDRQRALDAEVAQLRKEAETAVGKAVFGYERAAGRRVTSIRIVEETEDMGLAYRIEIRDKPIDNR